MPCPASGKQDKARQGPDRGGERAWAAAGKLEARASSVICLCRTFKHRGDRGNHREPPPAGTGRDRRAHAVLQPRVLLET